MKICRRFKPSPAGRLLQAEIYPNPVVEPLPVGAGLPANGAIDEDL